MSASHANRVTVSPEHEELLRQLAIDDQATAEAAPGTMLGDLDQSTHDARVHAVLRIAALDVPCRMNGRSSARRQRARVSWRSPERRELQYFKMF